MSGRIDPDRLRGAELAPRRFSWDADRVILYHLGIGAGDPPTDPGELSYTYERGLRVLPSFGVIPPLDVVTGMFEAPGLGLDPNRFLHGEHELVLHRPLPPAAEVETSGRILGAWDKGEGAIVAVETLTSDLASGAPLATNVFTSFVVGGGGFGGEPAPEPPTAEPPGRAPDAVMVRRTLPQQALIYRLSGDRNPLHAEPGFAARACFARPILHGLCTYGITLKAVVDEVLGGAPERVASFRVRFAGIVLPGETIEVSAWGEGERILLSARTIERDQPVLTLGAVETRL